MPEMTAPPTPLTRVSLSQLLRGYARPYRLHILLAVGLTLLSNLVALLNPAIFAMALAVFTGQIAHALPAPASGGILDLNHLGVRLVQRWLLPWSEQGTVLIIIVSGLYLAQATVTATLEYAASLTTLTIRTGVARLVQWDVGRHLLSQSLGFFHRKKSGELLSRLTQDAGNLGMGLGPLVRSVLHVSVQLIGYSVYLLSTNGWLTMGVLLVILLHFGLSQLLKRPIRRLARCVSDEMANLSSVLQETFTGIRVAKSFGAEPFELQKVRRAIDGVAGAHMRQGRVDRLEAPSRTVLDAMAIVGILLIAATQIETGAMTVHGLLLYVYVGRLVITPANQLATSYLWSQALLASYDRVNDLLVEPVRVVDGHQRKTAFDHTLTVRDVSFSYDGVPALHEVSLEIRRGDIVALVGPSGSGKSTLADLLLRFHDPDAGEILMDGANLKALRQADYRRLFGVVSQECLLFHDTVRNNIRYGRDDVTEEAMLEAARMANAHEFIMRLPHGYDTVVGDRGVRLSGGERQRVAIARAIVHRPDVLILDEATSALDSESERQVQLAIGQVVNQTTALIIAHRLSTILHADKIVVMDRGHIVDLGRHEDLLVRCGLYRRLCELQFLQHQQTSVPGSGTMSVGGLSALTPCLDRDVSIRPAGWNSTRQDG